MNKVANDTGKPSFDRRGVLKAAGFYLVISWAILQVADVVAPALFMPDWTVSFVLYLLIACFPVVLGLSWFFDLSLQGLKRDPETNTHVKPRMGLMLATLIMGATGFLIFGQMGRNYSAEAETVEKQRAQASLAVLPFKNMSADETQDYFVDGMSGEILNNLAHIKSLAITARSSSFAFKGQTWDVRSVGKALNVNYILEGSVQKAGSRVRITARLVETAGGTQLWSETYNRDVVDIFALQDDVSVAITENLSTELSKLGIAQIDVIEAKPLPNIDPLAYDLYLRAKSTPWVLETGPFTPMGQLTKIRDMYLTVTTLAPEFVEGWIALGLIERAMSKRFFGGKDGVDPLVALKNALVYLDKASDMAPESANVLAGYARAYYGYQNKKALHYAVEAIRKNPNLADTRALLSRLYQLDKQWKPSFEEVEEAFKLNPLDIGVQAAMAYSLAYQGRFADVYMVLDKNPEYWSLAYPGDFLSFFHILQGRHDLVAEDLDILRKWHVANGPGHEFNKEVFRLRDNWVDTYLSLGEVEKAWQSNNDDIDDIILIYQGKIEEAKAFIDKKMVRKPQPEFNERFYQYWFDHWKRAYAKLGLFQEIVDHVDEAGWNSSIRPPPKLGHLISPAPEVNIAFALKKAGQFGRANDWLRSMRAEYEGRFAAGFDLPLYHFDYARLLIVEGEVDAGLARLETAVEKGWSHWYTKYDSVFIDLKDNEKFKAIMAQHDAILAEQREAYLRQRGK